MMRTPPAIEPDGRREIAPPSKPSSVTTPIPGETVKRISQARPRRPMKSAPSVGETLDSLLARMSASDNPKIAAWGAALLERGECASNLTYKAAKS